MPYKDLKSERARETAKIRMRRYRERNKTSKKVKNSTGNCEFEITIRTPDRPLTPEEQTKYNEFATLLEEFMEAFSLASDEQAECYLKGFREQMHFIKERKPKKSFEGVRAFITNLLEMRLDLQGLKHRGGTA